MKKFRIANWVVILIALLPAAYLALVWNAIPDTVPTHYGADMKPDKTGEKGELWILCLVLAAVSVLTYLLLNNLHRIDPKRRGTTPSATFNRLGMGMVVFMAALNFLFIASAKGDVAINNFLFPLLGLLLAFIGNYMNNIKPNYFAGIRLPWTLSSDENWRRTHQLAGKMWFAGGLLLAIAGLVLPPAILFPVFLILILVMTLVPVIYSYRMYKQQV